LFPVQNLVSEIDYYGDVLVQLETFRIKEEKSNNNKNLDPKKKELYEKSKEKIITILEEKSQRKLQKSERENLFFLAQNLAKSKIEQKEKEYLIYKKQFDDLIRFIYNYEEKQRNFFLGLDFNQYRIESINTLRWQRFDTKNLSVVNEHSPINKISWQNPLVKDPLNKIYEQYKNNEPLIEPYSTQFSIDNTDYFLILKTIYQYPAIYERSIKILQSLQSKDKYQWKILSGKIKNINLKIISII